MAFIFENKKVSGHAATDQPHHAAVRITRHSEGSKAGRSAVRLYCAFTPEAVKLARWIAGDKIVLGFDTEAKMICFKRDQVNGYTIAGGALGGRGKGNVAFQLSTAEDSELWALMKPKIGQWLTLTDDGPLLVAVLD